MLARTAPSTDTLGPHPNAPASRPNAPASHQEQSQPAQNESGATRATLPDHRRQGKTESGAARASSTTPAVVPSTAQGQLFHAGLTFGVAGAALISGLGLVYGSDPLAAAGRGIFWFAGSGITGWLVELCLGPALERVERQQTLAGTGGEVAGATGEDALG